MLEVSRAELPDSPVWRPSRMCRAVEDALDFELMAPLHRGRGRLACASVFAVWKSDYATARLITWPADLNAMMPPPFSGLEPHPRLRALWARHSFGATLDMKGAFNQFPLSQSVQRLFTCKVGRAGRSRLLCARRLPMGWVGSPAICQRVLLLVLRVAGVQEDAFVHVDNIYLGGSSAADVQAKIDAVMAVCKSLDIMMLLEAGPSTSIAFLGLLVDLENKTAAFKPAFCTVRRWRQCHCCP